MATQPQNSGQANTPAPLSIKDPDTDPVVTDIFAGVVETLILSAARNVAATSSIVGGFTVSNDPNKPIAMTLTIGDTSRTFYLVLTSAVPTGGDIPQLTEEQLKSAKHEHNMKF